MASPGQGQVISWYVCTVATVPFVGLRLYSRWKRLGKLAIEDGLIVLALCCLIGDLAIQQHMFNLGLGDMSKATPADIKGILQMIVPGSTLYITSLWSVKFALVIFYKRLAAPGSKMVLAYNVALALLAVMYLVIFFDIIFQCFPYDKRWSSDPAYQCSARAAMVNYWITIFFNIFSDVAIICLPITMILRLQMKLKQKLGVAAIFALGIFVVIASIVRAIYSHKNETMLTCTVSMVENAIAIIAACLPALRSMFIGGDTTKGNSSYNVGKHYELSSARRKTNQQNSLGVHTSTIGGRTTHNPNDSEDSLVTDGSGPSSISGVNGIIVNTDIRTYEESTKSPSAHIFPYH